MDESYDGEPSAKVETHECHCNHERLIEQMKKSNKHLLYAFITFMALFVPIMLHSLFGITFSPVLTGSMRPGLNPGDMLFTRQVPAYTLKIGDISVLRDPQTYDLFSHRIVDVKTDKDLINITTKGDGNPAVDADVISVNKNAMVPKYIGHVKYVGRIIVAFANNKGKFVSYLLIGIILISTIPNIWILLRKSKTRKKRLAQEPKGSKKMPDSNEFSDEEADR